MSSRSLSQVVEPTSKHNERPARSALQPIAGNMPCGRYSRMLRGTRQSRLSLARVP